MATENIIQKVLKLDPFPQPQVVVTRHPIVLMHGFGILGSISKPGQQHHLAMHLRSHGVLAFAPNVAPYSTVPARALLWKERIAAILDATGHTKINVIGHSMGGLDARYLISKLGGHESIASLTTISTPHHGSSVASFILEQPSQFRGLATAALDWLGDTAYTEAPSKSLRAMIGLTPDYMANTFNPEVPDHPDVQYRSYAGRAGKGTSEPINPVFKLTNTMLFKKDGPNDGLVPVSSAQWGDYRGVIDADHARQIGIFVTQSDFDSEEFFLRIVEELSREGL